MKKFNMKVETLTIKRILSRHQNGKTNTKSKIHSF